MKTEQQEKFLQITKQSTIPFVTVGVASDVAGHVISEDAAIALIEAVEAGEAAQAALAGVQTELATANSTLATAQASLTTVQNELATAKTDLATANAKIVKLEKEDGGGFSTPNALHDAEGNLKVEFKTSADIEMEKVTAQ